jgi:hypothetical protein
VLYCIPPVLRSQDQGLGPQDHSSLVCDSLALDFETIVKSLGLALQVFCQDHGLGLVMVLKKRSWPGIFKTETSRPRQRPVGNMFLLTYSQTFSIKLVFHKFIVHKLEWIPLLDIFYRSLLFSRAFCKVLVSISRPLCKVLGIIGLVIFGQNDQSLGLDLEVTEMISDHWQCCLYGSMRISV